MEEGEFWELIRLLDWANTGNDDAVLEPLISRLASHPVEAIEDFEKTLAEKLFALDTRSHADAYSGNQSDHMSGDLFLYVRCCVIANGPEFYSSVLHNPGMIPSDIDFEPLLYVAASAYQRKTGKQFDYRAPINYETCSNERGWSI